MFEEAEQIVGFCGCGDIDGVSVVGDMVGINVGENVNGELDGCRVVGDIVGFSVNVGLLVGL